MSCFVVFCIERQDPCGTWVKELCFKTEFKAFVSARTKSMATLRTAAAGEGAMGEVALPFESSAGWHASGPEPNRTAFESVECS